MPRPIILTFFLFSSTLLLLYSFPSFTFFSTIKFIFNLMRLALDTMTPFSINIKMFTLIAKPWLHFPWLARILGLLLLVASALKLYGLDVDPVGQTGVFSSPEWQVGIVEMEVFFGLWLLSGVRPIGAWISALAVFAVFAVASCYQGWMGQASCGCFGTIEVNPWTALGLDIVVLSALLVGRPSLGDVCKNLRTSLLSALSPLFAGVVGIALVLGALTGLAYAGFGSSRAGLAYLRGERISAIPRLVDMGDGHAGEMRYASIEVRNWSDKPVRLIGGTSDCSCVVTRDLPLTVEANASQTFQIRMRLPRSTGVFNHSAIIMTDDERVRTLVFRLTGNIRSSAQ